MAMGKITRGRFRKRMLSLIISYRSVLANVLRSRTGERVDILELPPGGLREWEGELIDR